MNQKTVKALGFILFPVFFLVFFLAFLCSGCEFLSKFDQPQTQEPQKVQKHELDRGLTLYEYPGERTEGLYLLEADPTYFELTLLTASGLKVAENLNVKQWVDKYHLIAGTNAGMYQKDYKKSAGLLIANGHTNNPRVGKFKAVLAFGPKSKTMPPVQIIDRQCQPFKEIRDHYHSLLQGIRMVTCRRQNTWQKKGEKWPIAALGMTQSNKILMLFSKLPRTPHNFINLVLTLPEPKLFNMMYLEGGPPAQFYLNHEKMKLDLMGSQSKSGTSSPISLRVPIPNVLGLTQKRRQ